MKKIFAVISVLAICSALACTKDSGVIADAPAPVAKTPATNVRINHSTARMSGPNYSQSIPVDSANWMIQSYLTGVGYPSFDSSIRSLTFDADTLRSYLANGNITTLKFIFAHQPSYIGAAGFGSRSGLNSNAVTLVVVGLNDNDQYVLNNRNGVYEHMTNCPAQCPGNASPFIQ